MTNRCSTKSNSMSKTPASYGIADVVKPRGLTYRVTCHQWLISGACVSRILPTIWVHMCSVSREAVHSSTRNDGQFRDDAALFEAVSVIRPSFLLLAAIHPHAQQVVSNPTRQERHERRCLRPPRGRRTGRVSER